MLQRLKRDSLINHARDSILGSVKVTTKRLLVQQELLRDASLDYMHNGIRAFPPPIASWYIDINFQSVSYFLGCSSGNAIIINITWIFVPETGQMIFEVEQKEMKKISYAPIKDGFIFQHQPDRYFVVTEVATSSGEKLLQGFNLLLEPEWGFKCELVRQITSDKYI